MKTIFANIPDISKKEKLEKLCKELGINVRAIDPYDGERTLLSVVSGGKYELKETKSITTHKLPEIIVFQGFGDEELQEFLKVYREKGLEKIPLKAIVTPYNLTWTLNELGKHLEDERRSYS